MNETNRQKKIAGVLQNDLAVVLQKMLHESGQLGIIISVTKVTVTTDLSLSKVYTSVFPAEKSDDIVKELNELKKSKLRHQQIPILTRDEYIDVIRNIKCTKDTFEDEDFDVATKFLHNIGEFACFCANDKFHHKSVELIL